MIPFDLEENMLHTWFFDLDGTVFKWNGLFDDGYDTLLPGVKELWASIPLDDCIVITTARKSCWKEATIKGLIDNGLWYNQLVFDCNHGQRILVNDRKPEHGNIDTAFAWNVERDAGYL